MALGLAESTPGPLIMVVQFVGFLAGYQVPGGSLTLAVVGRVPYGMGHVRAMLSVDLSRRALRRITAPESGAERRIGGDHRRSGRRHRQSGFLVCLTRSLCDRYIASVRAGEALCAGSAFLQVVSLLLIGLALFMMFKLQWNIARTLPVCAAIGIAISLLT